MYKLKQIVKLFPVAASLVLIVLIAIFSIKIYPEIFKTEIFIGNSNELSPEEPVIVSFSKPMIPGSVAGRLKIFPETEVNYQWQDNNKKLLIIPIAYWEPGENYEIGVNGAKNMMLIGSNADFSFNINPYPKMESFIPSQGEKDVIIDIEDPIKAVFNRPLDDFRVKFNINPPVELAYQLASNNTEIEMLPKGTLEKGKKYNIEVGIKYKKAKEYKKIYETFFETLPPAPASWDKNFSVRLGQARRFTEPQIKEGKYIDISLKNQIMTIFQDGNILDAFLISSGKKGMDTPQGSYQIHNKYPRPWSKKYSLFMPFWMAIVSDGKFGIHELPEWPGGYKEGANHLGTPVSHGCVRLGVGPAKIVYEWADIGTPVIIY